MITRKLLIPVGIVVCLVCVALAQKPEPAPPVEATTKKTDELTQPKNPLELFMRKKLDASSKIMEGLCLEDAALIKEGADALGAMSKVEIWNVMLDPDYREHSREFRDNAAKLSAAAEAGDFDKAALRWFDVTMSCIECHDHVRNDRRAEKKK